MSSVYWASFPAFYLVPDECETATDSTPRRRNGSLVRADARRLPLHPCAATAADADLLPAEQPVRSRRPPDSGCTGRAQAAAAVPQAQRRRRGEGLRRPRRRPHQVLSHPSYFVCSGLFTHPRVVFVRCILHGLANGCSNALLAIL